MIKNIIFDFGDVFINLDKEGAMKYALNLFNISELSADMIETNEMFEVGKINSSEFLSFYKTKFPNLTEEQLIVAWNCILKDFPLHRLEFIKEITKKYNCYLLSNTNEMHIEWIINDWGIDLYNEFKSCFKKFYLSHEIEMRKPNHEIYKYVLNQNNLNASETLFIDDTKENTDAANKLGIYVWNNNPFKEDVVDLLSIKKELF